MTDTLFEHVMFGLVWIKFEQRFNLRRAIAWAGYASVRCLSVCLPPSGVTLMDCDHISWAAWNLISAVY